MRFESVPISTASAIGEQHTVVGRLVKMVSLEISHAVSANSRQATIGRCELLQKYFQTTE